MALFSYFFFVVENSPSIALIFDTAIVARVEFCLKNGATRVEKWLSMSTGILHARLRRKVHLHILVSMLRDDPASKLGEVLR